MPSINIIPISYIRTFSSVQFSHSVVSDSLRPHEWQHTRPPCPSPTPGVHPNSCASSWWCHPAISSSVVPFSSCPQSLPASGTFPMNQLLAWGGQNIGVSASLKSWCWSWNSTGGEGDNRRWDGWMASLTQWTWVWVNSGIGDGQRGLAFCSPWVGKKLDTTEWLNWGL